MSVNLKVKSNPTRTYPTRGDSTNYGTQASLWAQDVTNVLNATGYQYTWVMGSAAQVTTGEATHSDWTTLLAAASNGDSVWVKNGTYIFATMFVFNKRLTIQNESSDCIYIATAAIAADEILRFSSEGFSFYGGTIDAGAGTPDYGIGINANKCYADTILKGAFAIDKVRAIIPLTTFGGIIRDDISASVYGTASAGANVTLSNLGVTAVNASIIPNVDSAIDLGSATPKYFANAYIDSIIGADLVGGTVGNVTPVTIAKIDNITIDGDSIVDATNDMLINATGAGKDLTLQSNAEVNLSPITTANVIKGGIPCEIDYKVVIQDYTAVGSVGSASQQFAGHTLAVDDFTTSADVVAVYNLSNNQDLSANANHLTDEDNYNAGAGILGSATTAHKGVVNQHLNKDALAGMTAGGDVSLTIGGWHQTQAASAGLLGLGVLTDTKMQYYTDANKYIVFDVAGNLSSSVTIMTNAVYNHIVLVYDATNSVARGYVNAKLETEFACPTNLNISATPKVWINSKTDGTLELADTLHDECFVYDTKMTNAEIQTLYATSLAIPATLIGNDFTLRGRYKNLGVATDIRQYEPKIVNVRATDLLMEGGLNDMNWQSTDTRRIVGTV